MMTNKHAIDKHHRKCRSNGGTNDWTNLSYVVRIQHRAWHILFKNDLPDEIVNKINAMWLDPEYEIVLRKKN